MLPKVPILSLSLGWPLYTCLTVYFIMAVHSRQVSTAQILVVSGITDTTFHYIHFLSKQEEVGVG